MKLVFQWVVRNKVWTALIVGWIMFTFDIFGFRIFVIRIMSAAIIIVASSIMYFVKKL